MESYCCCPLALVHQASATTATHQALRNLTKSKGCNGRVLRYGLGLQLGTTEASSLRPRHQHSPNYGTQSRNCTKNTPTQTRSHLHAAAAAAAKSLQSCPTLCDPVDGSPSGSSSLGFSRQEHWSGLPFPSPMHESEK